MYSIVGGAQSDMSLIDHHGWATPTHDDKGLIYFKGSHTTCVLPVAVKWNLIYCYELLIELINKIKTNPKINKSADIKMHFV